MELFGLPTQLHGDELEEHVVDVFQTTRVEVKKRNFHVIHRLKKNCDSKTSEPARYPTEYFERKEKVTGLDKGSKNRLRTQKVILKILSQTNRPCKCYDTSELAW